MPTGVQWNTIPSAGATSQAQLAAQLELCRAASHWCDAQCAMPLHATSDIEEIAAPGRRASPDANGVLWITPLRKPVISVTTLETRPMIGVTTDYTTVTATNVTLMSNAGQEEFAAGAGTYRIRAVATGITKGLPWQSWSLRLTYVNGWANSELSAATLVNATSLSVVDATGFAVGDTIEIVDAANTETATITAVSSTTLTVAALTYAHAAGVQVTAMPANIRLAAGYYAAHLAMFRGSSAMAIPVASARRVMSSGSKGEQNYLMLAQQHLAPYRRVW